MHHLVTHNTWTKIYRGSEGFSHVMFFGEVMSFAEWCNWPSDEFSQVTCFAKSCFSKIYIGQLKGWVKWWILPSGEFGQVMFLAMSCFFGGRERMALLEWCVQVMSCGEVMDTRKKDFFTSGNFNPILEFYLRISGFLTPTRIYSIGKYWK